MNNVWYVEFPTFQYNEDVKDLARKNNLKIIDARFQGENKQCDNVPKLTKAGEKSNKKSLLEQYNEDKNIVDTLNLKDLKKLCKDLDIEFTEESEIREHLKATEPISEEE